MPSKTYGTVSAERRKEMSGLEFVQGMVAAAWSTIRTMEPFWILTGALGVLIIHKCYITPAEQDQPEVNGNISKQPHVITPAVTAHQERS